MMPREAVPRSDVCADGRAQRLGCVRATLGASGIFTAIVVCLATAGAVELGRRRAGAVRGELRRRRAGAAGAGLWSLHVSLAAGLSIAVSPLAGLGDSLVALLLITAIESALWLVGIHG